jgi:hypothetical protein
MWCPADRGGPPLLRAAEPCVAADERRGENRRRLQLNAGLVDGDEPSWLGTTMTLFVLAGLCGLLSGTLTYSAVRAMRTGWLMQFKAGGCDRQQNPYLFALGVTRLGLLAVAAAIGAVGALVCGSRPVGRIPLRAGWPVIVVGALIVFGNLVHVALLEPFGRRHRHRLSSLSPWNVREHRRVLVELLEERRKERTRHTT